MAQRFRRSARQVYREVAGEHLLVDLHSKSTLPFYALTPTAVVLWGELVDWRSPDELAAALRERFDVDDATATADVREFLDQLETIGGVERTGGDEP